MPHVAAKKLEDRGEVFNPGDVVPGVEAWPTFRELKGLGWIELVEESRLEEYRTSLANPMVIHEPVIKLTPLPEPEERDPNRVAEEAMLEPTRYEPNVQTQTPMREQVATNEPPVELNRIDEANQAIRQPRVHKTKKEAGDGGGAEA